MSSSLARVAGGRSVAALALALLAGCTLSSATGAVRTAPQASPRGGGTSDLQRRLVSEGERFIGARTFVVRGRRFASDCTGLILAIYYSAGIDLERVMARHRGGGVQRLHSALGEAGLLHRNPRPEAADLAFWDDTYDADRDGRWDDPLTHVGMVMEVRREGTIVVIHYHYARGAELAAMNLARPSEAEGRTAAGGWTALNSPMRMTGTARPGDPTLAGELFRDFAGAWRLAL